jgi:Flp pilus assembly protein protease CpaA
MNILLVYGTRIVIFALIAYTIAVITEQRTRRVSNRVLWFLTAGIILDITATILMISGSSNTPFTLHGLLGYSSLGGMLIDTILIWRHRLQKGSQTEVPNKLHLYSRYAYIWWILAFITGALLVLFK